MSRRCQRATRRAIIAIMWFLGMKIDWSWQKAHNKSIKFSERLKLKTVIEYKLDSKLCHQTQRCVFLVSKSLEREVYLNCKSEKWPIAFLFHITITTNLNYFYAENSVFPLTRILSLLLEQKRAFANFLICMISFALLTSQCLY